MLILMDVPHVYFMHWYLEVHAVYHQMCIVVMAVLKINYTIMRPVHDS